MAPLCVEIADWNWVQTCDDAQRERAAMEKQMLAAQRECQNAKV